MIHSHMMDYKSMWTLILLAFVLILGCTLQSGVYTLAKCINPRI